ncbi:MAG TPA: nucleotidyltransferase family protein [Pyrinomonadaceae bacterium]|nr:nucleotidyltransferase family protein [Pyrinomonadaceae bacterium]
MPPLSLAQLLAATLEGSWRAEPTPAHVSAGELASVVPMLVGSGAAPLAWWKIRHTELATTQAAHELREVYRYRTLRAAIQEREIEAIFKLLARANVEAVLVKGWAAARAYPEQGLRPFGDLDVCVRAERLEDARRALDAPESAGVQVDLHAGFDESDERGFEALHARGETVRIGEASVRVLAPEDHLRLMCIHLLRHGAWRPLWLCDVAAAIETRRDGFDWSRIDEGDSTRARWVACAVTLAHVLLGARVEGTPFESESRCRLPRWLVPEVLKQWETPFPASQAPMRYRAPMRDYVRRPRGLWRDLLSRWPNPIEATVRVGGAFNELPRWPFQLANCFGRAARFLGGSTHAAADSRMKNVLTRGGV